MDRQGSPNKSFRDHGGDLPGGPEAKTLPCNAGGAVLIPGWGSWDPSGLAAKSQSMKRKQYGNTFNKDFKNGPHQKKKKNLKK